MSWKLRKEYDSLDERLKALGLNFSLFCLPENLQVQTLESQTCHRKLSS